MWCDTGQVLPRAGSQQFGEVSWGDLPYWGACLDPRIRLCSPGGFSQLLSWDFAGVRAFCPSHPSNTQQHLGLGIPQILPPAWNAHPAPSPPSSASRSPLSITPSRGALCGSTHPASYPRRITTSPRAHSSLSLSFWVDLLKGETVPESLPATPNSPPTRRVPSRGTPRVPAPLPLSPFSPPDRDRRVDSPAFSGRGSRPSRRTSG